jgi:hypothetical protein
VAPSTYHKRRLLRSSGDERHERGHERLQLSWAGVCGATLVLDPSAIVLAREEGKEEMGGAYSESKPRVRSGICRAFGRVDHPSRRGQGWKVRIKFRLAEIVFLKETPG